MAAKQVIVTRITRTRKNSKAKSPKNGQKRCPTCGKYR